MPFTVDNALVAQALADRGYTEPTPVQAAVADPALGGADLLVSARTGSGKTVAYGLAMVPTLLDGAERFPGPTTPKALVVAPTRELALQVHRELAWLYGKAGGRVLTCVGGMDPQREKKALAMGADVVVGTPGRLRDHMERGRLITDDLSAVVLDEADEMLNLGFREDLEFILGATPTDRRTLLFSATLPAEIVRLATRFQREAVRIDVTEDDTGHADIDYRALRIAGHEIEKAVVNVLRWYEARAAIVFCATREAVRRLHGALQERGFQVVALSGEMTQADRNQALTSMRDGRARVCVATDVAARGIDLPDLGLVVHAELPNDPEVLTHRSGRTGRAGRKGTAVLLVPHSRRRKAESLLAGAGVVAEWAGAPTAEEIRRLDGERLAADPMLTEEPTEEDLELARRLAEGRSSEELAAALIRYARVGLPSPEELIVPAAERPERRAAAEGPRVDEGAVWFRLAVGRRDGAEVRHILPLICRRAAIPKREIGTIRIGDRETLFAVTAAAAGQVAFAAANGGPGDVPIAPADGEPVAPQRRRFKDDGRPAPAGRPTKPPRRKERHG
ncbi:DEAD/DEAH box helicase [Oharaeibacter diazotrophicus]|uniref:ATP-dependent RNA helicase DeaD n=2 Tax=Oharaeibacter diazotrophicus TaxID=1920512 RepID=A0A4R6RK33_9HYPH|nr:DEAD/DEAH box helicase [Oharaeibacter diazotrophicus]TDP86465.1 ATP-dependent RNA helicase DeaD [Oharaeibacter diazotrophicus]BBE71593.1 ATP-dependent RNA helicase DeaD [Pleomorphomonas sp. SM30]GLS78355.1 DEAD/DEAH box helicase [Oharaeibacter diazotrophicus]